MAILNKNVLVLIKPGTLVNSMYHFVKPMSIKKAKIGLNLMSSEFCEGNYTTAAFASLATFANPIRFLPEFDVQSST
jgi:hypothetical protein